MDKEDRRDVPTTTVRSDDELTFDLGEVRSLPTSFPTDMASRGDDAVTPTGPLKPGDRVVDRYQIIQRLGSGGFGTVYSAEDLELHRRVAIKQSRALRSFVSGQVRNEARSIAALNHSNIVQIHDLIQVSDHELVIVMECLEGESLYQRMHRTRIVIGDAVKIGVQVASALQHAHQKQLVHSDLKPGNLFLCHDGTVKLLDFGLAIAYFPDQDVTRIGGTPGYMSPEQIRGESHLIDGRSDIWAFGIVLYEMLTGSAPFHSMDGATTRARTLSRLVPPPRQLNPAIDLELQRIVMKCLQPLITARYESSTDLQDDLRQWLSDHGSSATVGSESRLSSNSFPVASSELRLSQRGLQPFTESDASVYLTLIPGPRGRDGVPDSIRFWKRWVESEDVETDHPVGVLYGPSGSGKTSYVRAGLFQQLDSHICRVYVECRPGDLGGRLTQIIETCLESRSGESSLRDLLIRFRSGSAPSSRYDKLLIVLDQFESWAQSASLAERQDLAEALRQCDGKQIRALIVTRDDFWTGVKELLNWLEIPVQERRNVARVELLDPDHAASILESVGREMQVLPAEGESLSDEQHRFIRQAVDELTIDGSVICVHLLMFAQMLRLQQWTPRALRDSGGVVGACSMFFQELFSPSSRKSPEYTRVAPAVQIILSELVPSPNITVAEISARRKDLTSATSTAGHQHLFDDAMRLLSEELRVVSVVASDPIGGESSQSAESPSEPRYRLAHDFLVVPVATFLERSRSRTWSGRTMARLSELSDTWSRRPIRAYLPSFGEFLMLWLGSSFQRCDEKQSDYLRAAAKMHSGKISVAVVALLGFLIMSFVAWYQWQSANESRQRALASTIDSLFHGPAGELPARMAAVQEFGANAFNQVSGWQDSADANNRLISRIYLQTSDPTSFQSIGELLKDARLEQFDPILSIARQTSDTNAVLTRLSNDLEDRAARIRAAILSAYLDDLAPIVAMMTETSDGSLQDALLNETIGWRGDPQRWADLVLNHQEPLVRYYSALILGGYPVAELQASDISIDFASLINSPDALIHSIGRFLARRWDIDVWSIPLNPPGGSNWMVGPDNMPMVRIEPKEFTSRTSTQPPSSAAYSVDQPFWMSVNSVSRRFYLQFMTEQPLLTNGDPSEPSIAAKRTDWPEYLLNDENQPLAGASLDQAYEFCNWLSRREGLPECYQRQEKQPVPFGKGTAIASRRPIQWDYDPKATGYHVPTYAEFLLAAQTHYEAAHFEFIRELGVASGTSDPKAIFAQPLHNVPPSAFGLFVLDRNCGTWICGEEIYTSMSNELRAIHAWTLLNPPLPSNTIFLVRSIIDDQRGD